jgi:hypothetical protein
MGRLWIEVIRPARRSCSVRFLRVLFDGTQPLFGGLHDIASAKNFITGAYKPNVFHSAATRALVVSSIKISSGHGRVNPSVAHFRVASMPIFEP